MALLVCVYNSSIRDGVRSSRVAETGRSQELTGSQALLKMLGSGSERDPVSKR